MTHRRIPDACDISGSRQIGGTRDFHCRRMISKDLFADKKEEIPPHLCEILLFITIFPDADALFRQAAVPPHTAPMAAKAQQ